MCVCIHICIHTSVCMEKNLGLFATNCEVGDIIGYFHFPGNIYLCLKFETSMYYYFHNQRNQCFFPESKFQVYLLSFPE